MILWPGNESHLQAEVMGWEGRANRCTTDNPGCDAGCPEAPGCRVGGRSTTPWWSVPESTGRDERRRMQTPAGSPPHKCQQWRQRQRPEQRPDLRQRKHTPGTMKWSSSLEINKKKDSVSPLSVKTRCKRIIIHWNIVIFYFTMLWNGFSCRWKLQAFRAKIAI